MGLVGGARAAAAAAPAAQRARAAALAATLASTTLAAAEPAPAEPAAEPSAAKPATEPAAAEPLKPLKAIAAALSDALPRTLAVLEAAVEGARGSAPQGMLAALESLTTLAELHPRFFKQSLPGVAAGMSATARSAARVPRRRRRAAADAGRGRAGHVRQAAPAALRGAAARRAGADDAAPARRQRRVGGGRAGRRAGARRHTTSTTVLQPYSATGPTRYVCSTVCMSTYSHVNFSGEQWEGKFEDVV